ncbi:MAG: DUF1549 domain-containing protein [Planctomycetes bacterium]|nr:DUF1549 domain-containing protein [Planctomycetota bacterium]
MSSMNPSQYDENVNALPLQPIEPAAERVLDAFLLEMLRADRPGDSQVQAKKIADRIESDRFDPDTFHGFFTVEELDMAAQAAQRDIRQRDLGPRDPKRLERMPSFVVAPPIQVTADSPLTLTERVSASGDLMKTPSAVAPTSSSNDGRGDLGGWVFLAVAASLVGTLLGISWWQRSEEQKFARDTVNAPPAVTSNPNAEETQAEKVVVKQPDLDRVGVTGLGQGVVSSDPRIAPSNNAVDSNDRPLAQNEPRDRMQSPDAPSNKDRANEIVVANDLPNDPNTEVAAKDRPSASVIASMASGAKPITLGASEDIETIGVIDDQFQHLWKRLDIETRVVTDREQLEDRIGMIVIGRAPTSAERESVRKSAKNARDAIEQLASKWIASDEFDQYWADSLARYYVGVNTKSTEEPNRQAFVDWLRQAIHRNEPIGVIERSMVTADPKNISSSPEAYWVKHWLESGIGSEHLLLDSGSRKAVGLNRNQLGSLESLATQSFKLAGKSTAVCSHCHAENSKSQSDRVGWSENLSQVDGGQASGLFAGLAAVWSTIAGTQTRFLFGGFRRSSSPRRACLPRRQESDQQARSSRGLRRMV